MNLNLRIFLAYFLVLGVGAYLLLDIFTSELRPGVRQSMEDTLVDMSNLLAEVVAVDFARGNLEQSVFARSIDKFLQRKYKADIFLITKQRSEIRIYITDASGIVVYDSSHKALGQDYSRWNDVYLTLRGQYGARSSKTDPLDDNSSVMHVAAPVINNNHIVGVLTVAKPNVSVQPFIDTARNKIRKNGLLLVGVSLLIGAFLSYWLTRSIRALSHYADAIAKGERAVLPRTHDRELSKLANAMETMRTELEGKDYVEKYIHALTHELKSPVAAIKGAVELLDAEMEKKDRQRFIHNIDYEVERIDEIIERLLALAALEARDKLENAENFDLCEVVAAVVNAKQAMLNSKDLEVSVNFVSSVIIYGEKFLVAQAVDNLLSNAIAFSPQGGRILVTISNEGEPKVGVLDQGPGIPDYAQDKIFERFYSLPRPHNGKKSSGLGLNFIGEVMQLHGGSVRLENKEGQGVQAWLCFASPK